MSWASALLADAPEILLRLGEASGSSAADASGNAHTGTRSGGATFGAAGIGDAALAASFDGVDGMIKTAAGFGPAVYTEFAFGIIAKPATLGAFMFMLGFYGATDDYAYMAMYADGSFDFGWNLSDNVNAPPGTLTAGVEHDFFVDQDATTCTLYLDGVAVATAPANDLTFVEVGGVPFRIGFDEDGDPFDGVLAGAVFFDHSVGATRVAAYHAARIGGTVTSDCIAVELNGWLFDSVTQDADGVCYSWQTIDGWFDSPDLQIGTQPRPIGVSETVVQVGGRTMALNGSIHNPNPTQPLTTALAMKAMRRLKRNCACMFVSALLLVDEIDIALQARVRQSAPIRYKLIGSNQGIVAVEFQIPLLAPDPRRYSSIATTDTQLSLTGSATTDDKTLVNNGDIVTPPVITIDGPATNPYVRNYAVTGDPFVQYNGTLGSGDTLVLDMLALTAVLNGTTDVAADLSGPAAGPPAWWQLEPGNNLVRLGRSAGSGTSGASFAYRDAYS